MFTTEGWNKHNDDIPAAEWSSEGAQLLNADRAHDEGGGEHMEERLNHFNSFTHQSSRLLKPCMLQLFDYI